MHPIPSLRHWMAACGACAAASASAQSPALPAIPPPKIDYPVATASRTTAPPLVLPARLAPVERIGTPIADALPPIPAAPEVQPPAPVESLTAAAPCEAAPACAPVAGKKHAHEKCETTKYGNVRTCKIPPSSAVAHGAVVRSIFERQRQLALAEYFVVYREDFSTNAAELNETGLRHIAGIAKRLDAIDDSVNVEPTGLAKLDEARRDAVIQALIQAGASTGVSGRVGTGTTRAEGLRYEDVPAVGRKNPVANGGGNGSGSGQNGAGGTGSFGGIR